ncbi:MAG: hypothetical protein SGPRY_013548 [Prymnesium sp.]
MAFRMPPRRRRRPTRPEAALRALGGPPVYESCCGTLIKSAHLLTLENPVCARQEMNERIERMVKKAHSSLPTQKMVAGVTLIAHKERRNAKAARELAENARREALIYEIYEVPPERGRLISAPPRQAVALEEAGSGGNSEPSPRIPQEGEEGEDGTVENSGVGLEPCAGTDLDKRCQEMSAGRFGSHACCRSPRERSVSGATAQARWHPSATAAPRSPRLTPRLRLWSPKQVGSTSDCNPCHSSSSLHSASSFSDLPASLPPHVCPHHRSPSTGRMDGTPTGHRVRVDESDQPARPAPLPASSALQGDGAVSPPSALSQPISLANLHTVEAAAPSTLLRHIRQSSECMPREEHPAPAPAPPCCVETGEMGEGELINLPACAAPEPLELLSLEEHRGSEGPISSRFASVEVANSSDFLPRPTSARRCHRSCPQVSEPERVRRRSLKIRQIMREAINLSKLSRPEVIGEYSSISNAISERMGAGAGGDVLASVSAAAVRTRHVVEALQCSSIFADLGESQLSMMAAAGKTLKLGRYSVLYREGSESTNFYVLSKGVMQEKLTVDGKEELRAPVRVNAGRECRFVLIGIEALLRKPRQSSYVALENCELIKFNTTDLNIRNEGTGVVAQRVFQGFVESELRDMELFADLSERTIRDLVPLFRLEQYKSGYRIFAEGEPAMRVYIMLSGALSIARGNLEMCVLETSSGEENILFGEMALLDRKPRMVTVHAKSVTQLLVLDVQKFPTFMGLSELLRL